MLFEVFDRNKNVVFTTTSMEVLKAEGEDTLTAISKGDHKFKLDGKAISLKALLEKIK